MTSFSDRQGLPVERGLLHGGAVMLVLSRKTEQGILIRVGDVEVRVSVQEIRGNVVRLGLDGPDNAEFIREELLQDQPDKKNGN